MLYKCFAIFLEVKPKRPRIKNKRPIKCKGPFESNKNFGCGAGNTILTINNDGQVNPCVCVPLSIGNVKKVGLKKCYEDFGRYFKTTGKTCYGKRISKTIVEETSEDLKIPYDDVLSKKIMEKHIVDETNAKLYR